MLARLVFIVAHTWPPEKTAAAARNPLKSRTVCNPLLSCRATRLGGISQLCERRGARAESTMRVLLSSIGSRGDVQPILALALELRRLGHQGVLLVAPNFKSWVESFGVECIPIGPDVKKYSTRFAQKSMPKPTKEQMRQLAQHTVRDQFKTTQEAARGCDLVVAGGALQTAARSVGEALKIPYLYAAYCPVTLPSPDHPPPKLRARFRPQSLPGLGNRLLWKLDERSWDGFFLEAVNEQRLALGLVPVEHVRDYVSTDRPWLAADPVLGPPASYSSLLHVTQTGAWLLTDSTPLPDAVEAFLAAGEPPVYFGFGSMAAAAHAGPLLVETARALGRRAIISQGWAELGLGDGRGDCISIGDCNHERLFGRVAAIVHHGGAGTTVAAARSGKPQAVVPHNYDQYYWARRVAKLGIGVRGPQAKELTAGALTKALRECLRTAVGSMAQSVAGRVELNGARNAAERLVREFG
jgi:vancomycin aglycone glucosyltransferase